MIAVIEAQGWGVRDITIANLMPTEAKTALAAGAVDAWCSWGVYIAQGKLVDGYRVVADGSNGLLSGLSYLVATEQAIGSRREPLLDFTRRLAQARRWAQAHPDEYARMLAAEIGVTEPVARLTFDIETPVPVPIDDRVITDEQRTADRYMRVGVIHDRLVAANLFNASFSASLAG